MERVTRVDFGRLDGSVERTPQGGIRADAHLTRTGVFVYRNPDGTERRELRPASEVFKADSMGTLAAAPITDNHPPEGIVEPSTWKTRSVGHLGEKVRQDGQYLAGTVYVQDGDSVQSIERGDKRQVSCGYRCHIDQTPGQLPDGTRFDAVQRDIEYNHVAIVAKGRAGDDVGIKMDAADAPAIAVRVDEIQDDAPADPAPKQTRQDAMSTIRIDGVDYQIGDGPARQAVEKAIAERDQRIDALTQERDKAAAERDARAKERDEHKARADKAESAERLDELARERAGILEGARKLAGEEAKLDGSNHEVRKQALQAADPELKLDDASEAYVAAYFDAEVRRADKAPAQRNDAAGVRRAVAGPPAQPPNGNPPKDEQRNDARSAREKMVERRNNAWKGGQEQAAK